MIAGTLPAGYLAKLLKAHGKYMAKVRASGGTVVAYQTPCCKKELESQVPKDDATWDTLSTCPYCGELYMKITSRNGVATYTLPDDGL